ncbi:MAG: NAD(P)-dependent oxidoreductase, partial [Dehalococcoidia bacterium]|nr:NAD(P)-dependent oxidoreductase [Dehalococcoidia bacterium]
MKVLITGITGRVGANIAQNFLERGYDVRGFVWPGDRQAEKMKAIGAEIVEGDLANSADVNAAADGQEVILHLGAAFQAGGPFTPEQYFDTNVKGTFNVLEASLGLGDHLKHVLITSTDATMFKYPESGITDPIAEDSLPLSSTNWYG